AGTLCLGRENCCGPGRGPCHRIGDREFVEERLGGDAGETLDHMQSRAGSPEVRLVSEIRCVDDQRIAFPSSTRLSPPLPDVLWYMRTAVQRNDASVVDHFGEYHHVSGSLQELNIIVVSVRSHRL